MNSFVVILLLVAVFFQTSSAFVSGSRAIHLKRGPLAPLKMTTGSAWELKSITEAKLFEVVSSAIAKQLDEVDQKDVKLTANLVEDYEADSVDVVAVLLSLEGSFKDELAETNTKVPMEKLGKVVTVKDLFDLMYEVIKEVESKKK